MTQQFDELREEMRKLEMLLKDAETTGGGPMMFQFICTRLKRINEMTAALIEGK